MYSSYVCIASVCSGGDLWDIERDTVVNSEHGGRKKYYEPIIDKGPRADDDPLPTEGLEPEGQCPANDGGGAAQGTLRGFGAYSVQRHQFLLAMLQQLAMDAFLYNRVLKVMNCDRELMAAL